jgi:hypothetical protein
MKSKMLAASASTVVMLLIVGYGSSFAAGSAATECSAIAEGSEGSIAACEQGFKGTNLTVPLVKTCLRGVGEVAVFENQLDCKMGYIAGGGGTKEAPKAGAKAVAECASITEGGSPEACEQGYTDAVAGLKMYEACDHLGAGAIVVFENVSECEMGWLAGKARDLCIPGSDVQNGQPGTILDADSEADKTCGES